METRSSSWGPYAPEIVSGLAFTVVIPLLIGIVLEPQFLGLPVFAPLGLFIAGSILLSVGLVVGFGGVLTLAREVGPRFAGSPPRLCRRGPYAYVRNPGYLGGVLTMLGLALLSFSPITSLFAVAIWARLHLVVVRFEEPMLGRIFGEEYEAYGRQAGRWLPRLRRA